ncbi:hypothetical protein BACPLE_00867 [Phocaeicola plebeius DSM 17135]|uniref:Uncharacterized protein n=1 Tax=Phocaeicola plebeius (strain DSM 17135 / JCM 12973 / CCUG 54634 / M2) TaxID=484018 RepID=B5CVX9_PHOPM|nr:hypothetical protein BACPLE_00867 [Phocaeicola plebeius DSM 17135]
MQRYIFYTKQPNVFEIYFTIFFQFFSEWLVISHIKKVGTEDFSCQPFVFMDEYEIYFSN